MNNEYISVHMNNKRDTLFTILNTGKTNENIHWTFLPQNNEEKSKTNLIRTPLHSLQELSTSQTLIIRSTDFLRKHAF